MPPLSEASYSREATITAVREYYHFLTEMCVDASEIIEPPPEGWPLEKLRCLGKTDEVMSLLAHLPYIRTPPTYDGIRAQGAPYCYFVDWQGIAGQFAAVKEDSEILRSWNEGYGEWRNDGSAWSVVDFFALLKEHFRRLDFIPLNNCEVVDVFSGDFYPIAKIQEVYHEHGWPDLKQYRKADCLAVVEPLVEWETSRRLQAIQDVLGDGIIPTATIADTWQTPPHDESLIPTEALLGFVEWPFPAQGS